MPRKVLFDHCVPSPLKDYFGGGLEITRSKDEGLAKVRNSELERRAFELGYEALITVDGDFGEERNHREYKMPLVLLRAFPRGVVGGFWHYYSKT